MVALLDHRSAGTRDLKTVSQKDLETVASLGLEFVGLLAVRLPLGLMVLGLVRLRVGLMESQNVVE